MRDGRDGNFISNQKGQGLIETIIGGAIIVLAALAMVQVTVQSASMTSDSRTVTEFTALTHELRALIATEQTCRLALQSQHISSAQQPIQIYQPFAGSSVFLADPTVAGSCANATPSCTVWNGWTILQLNLSPDTGAAATTPNWTIRPMVLFVSAQRTGSPNSGKRQTTAIRLSVKTDNSNNIMSCSAITYGTDLTPAPTCTSLQALTSDGTRLYCRTVRCQSGIWNGSYDSAGNVICQ